MVQGLSDTLSSQYARMRVCVRACELLGGYLVEGATLSLTRRLLLVGCHATQSGLEDTVVEGPKLSRPVLLKPCGEAQGRAAFHAAMVTACKALDPQAGLVFAVIPGTFKEPTLCALTLTSNKQRPLLELQPVTVWGLAQQPSAPSASSALRLCAKVQPAVDPSTGLPSLPIYLKAVAESSFAVQDGRFFVFSNVRPIFRVSTAFGLLSYKGQGAWKTLTLRAVDMERADDADVFFPKPAAPPPQATSLLSSLGLASGGASAAAPSTATPPPQPLQASPILDIPQLSTAFASFMKLVPGGYTAEEVAAAVRSAGSGARPLEEQEEEEAPEEEEEGKHERKAEGGGGENRAPAEAVAEAAGEAVADPGGAHKQPSPSISRNRACCSLM